TSAIRFATKESAFIACLSAVGLVLRADKLWERFMPRRSFLPAVPISATRQPATSPTFAGVDEHPVIQGLHRARYSVLKESFRPRECRCLFSKVAISYRSPRGLGAK